jgi:5,8-dihydroxy-2-naphthoate synthase
VATVPIRVGHSADPDDAFMFWALDAGRVDARGLEFEQVVSDIQTLNEWALDGRLEVTAVSAGAYPHIAERYVLLPHGASMGDGYGPVVVAREEVDLNEVEIVVPGRLTTAYLVLRLALGEPRIRELPFDRILDEVRSGRADAGLLIHEGQLTYADAGLRKLLDLGEWWQTATGLPLPLGVNVARRDLHRLSDVSAVLGEAIRVGLENRDEALAYAERFGRGIDRETADRFVAMYVNELTTDYGDRGRRAVEELFRRAGTPVEVTYA